MNRAFLKLLFLSGPLALALAPAVAAQSIGERVRVSVGGTKILWMTFGGSKITGDAASVDDTAIVVETEDGEPRQITSADIRRIERSTGTRTRAWDGFGYGILLGGSWFAVELSSSDSSTDVDCDQRGNQITCKGQVTGNVATNTTPHWRNIGLGLLAAGVGAGVGALFTTDRWEEIPIGDQDQTSLRPVADVRFGRHGQPPALLVGARIRF